MQPKDAETVSTCTLINITKVYAAENEEERRMSSPSEQSERHDTVVMRFINDWEDLKTVDESKTHRLEIEEYSGWVYSKSTGKHEYYLSTHTFYGSMYQRSSEILQNFGFNVQLKNWDA